MGVKVFVVDDSAVVRQALAHMLSGNAEVELIGSAPFVGHGHDSQESTRCVVVGY